MNQDQIRIELDTEALINSIENLSSRDALQYLRGQAYQNVIKALDQLHRIVQQTTEPVT